MNATADSDVRIMKPFEDGYAIMKAILFQPFELNKWLVIGFAAFIAGHFTGGGGFSPPWNFHPPGLTGAHSDATGWDFSQHSSLIIGLFALLGVFFIVLVLVFMWVRARGIFVFTDCIVRNRAAIKEPWREYRREGNSFFLFNLALLVVIVFVIGVVIGACFLVASLVHFSRDQGFIALMSVGVLGFMAYFCFCVIFGVIIYFMPMVMYRRRCLAMEAFRAVGSLFWKDPGAFTLFVLFGILLLLGSLMVALAVACATCCIALMPYVGTVFMLPVFVWLRSFGLLFFRQFGPDCDVWAGASPIPPTPPPLPPVQVATT